MERVKDNEEPPEEYWKDFEDEKEELDATSADFSSGKLMSEISLKDICDGKEVIFQTGKDLTENFDDYDDISDDTPYYDIKSLRENRGAPPLDCSFKVIASTMTNLSEDGFVKKEIISSGVGKIVPEHAYVTVHYNLYKESCELPFDSTYLRNRPEKFKLGQGEALLGLEEAIKSMKKNENSIFFIKWERAFGALGCPDRIEGKCDIVADITLMNFMDLQSGDLSSLSEKDLKKIHFEKFINQTKKLLCNGSDAYSKGDANTAALSYKKALKILSSIKLANEEQESIMLKQKVKSLVNLAICCNKLGRHEQACRACQEALSIDYSNVKAHFHYGKASIALSNFPMAQRCLFRANKLKPNDKDINSEIKKLNDKKALYEMKDKLFWKKAFGEEENKKTSQPKDISSLENFEKDLLLNLNECLKADKPLIMSRSFNEEELKICRKVAEERNVHIETHPHFIVLKLRKNNCQTE